ncbi:MAG: SDR family NAD(P)-dependent oxidoreductase [Thermanaerothrix sp.]|jgi:NAD(P)-dependent dehydrogenase (short-subunit alcohol dehydrogenase family)|uniref:SDR family NAD(P)-dependent oxidoreductase n=2 Tax=Thermanaerothrix TaxID=1077886 RepID=A0ABU3NMV6_9CHLR|nr:SDR family NAD(P)-dependent oxidoreductase [Thermanaerothrix sp. 4228-RoL]MDT8898152.1 SDR family NAD(P)-dependent oxidoreductase [Thermanaerothrix sp. 4228-RoL]
MNYVPSWLDLSGQVAVITGASGWLGQALARRFALAGAAVALHYFTHPETIPALLEDIQREGGKALGVQANLSQEDGVDALLQATLKAYGKVDIWINNAGTYPVSPLLDLPLSQWQEVLDINLNTVFISIQKVARQMIAQGRGGVILNIASIEGLSPAVGHSHYSSAKAAVIMLTRAAAYELGPYGIRVNALSPGLIARPGLEEAWPKGVRSWLETAPLKRMGQPEEIAEACLFLASPAASWITGANLVMDGGASCRPIF